MQRRMMVTQGTANKLGVTIPLNTTAMNVLRAIEAEPARDLSRVFMFKGAPLNSYGKAWYKALKRAEIEGFNWHGLRHTFNTWLAREGVPKEFRALLCGWARKDTADRYTHLNVDHLRPSCAVIDTLLAQKSGE